MFDREPTDPAGDCAIGIPPYALPGRGCCGGCKLPGPNIDGVPVPGLDIPEPASVLRSSEIPPSCKHLIQHYNEYRNTNSCAIVNTLIYNSQDSVG